MGKKKKEKNFFSFFELKILSKKAALGLLGLLF